MKKIFTSIGSIFITLLFFFCLAISGSAGHENFVFGLIHIKSAIIFISFVSLIIIGFAISTKNKIAIIISIIMSLLMFFPVILTILHNYKVEKVSILATNEARPFYKVASEEFKEPQTIIDVISVPGTYGYCLLTNKNLRLTSEKFNGISLINIKTLIGKKVDVHIDSFVSGSYPVYKYIDQWYYSVTIYYNGKLIDKNFFNK